MSDELRKQLTQVRSDLRDLREDRAQKNKARESAKEEYSEVLTSDDDSKIAAKREAAAEAVRAHGEIVDLIGDKEREETQLLDILGDREAADRQPPAETGVAKPQGWGSSHLLADPGIRTELERISNTKARFGSMQIGEIATRDELMATLFAAVDSAQNTEPSATMRRGAYRGILPQLLQPIRFLDLVPTGTTDGNLVPYTQESGAVSGAGNVAEGDVKPEAAPLVYTDVDSPVRTIAAWMKARKQGLSDYPALQSILDGRLRYIVRRHLEGQVLNGDGTGQNLEGILQTDGIGSVAYNASIPFTEQLLSGITNVYLEGGEADGVALAPVDWNLALTEKAHNAADTAGSYDYRGGGPFGTTPRTVWGVPCVPVPALSTGTALVGDFALGVSLLIREGLSVLLSDSDQDDFIRNRITLLAEMRAALLVWRPSVFQEVHLAA
jgi:HK97 family phage major capsid protein